MRNLFGNSCRVPGADFCFGRAKTSWDFAISISSSIHGTRSGLYSGKVTLSRPMRLLVLRSAISSSVALYTFKVLVRLLHSDFGVGYR